MEELGLALAAAVLPVLLVRAAAEAVRYREMLQVVGAVAIQREEEVV